MANLIIDVKNNERYNVVAECDKNFYCELENGETLVVSKQKEIIVISKETSFVIDELLKSYHDMTLKQCCDIISCVRKNNHIFLFGVS